MNSENSKTYGSHRLLLNLTDKTHLKRKQITQSDISLSKLSIYYIWKKIKKSYKNNKFTIQAPT